MGLKFTRETDVVLEQIVSQDLLSKIHVKILNMTNEEQDAHVPTTEGIEMVLLALEQMPEVILRSVE